jgi:gliding motility-associated-like protein
VGQTVTILVRALGNTVCETSPDSKPVMGIAAEPNVDKIFVANAFTPNGDGKNDIVYVHNDNIKTLKFYIYDQWGNMLFQSQSPQKGWDGTYKGKLQPVGVYVYYLEAIMNDGQPVTKKGTITLLR